PDCLIAPAMQQAKQPFGIRLQLLARLTLNAGKHTGDQPTRLAHLDHGNDRAILVQGNEGPAQVVRLGHQGTPSVRFQRRWCHFFAACPIPSHRWREPDSNHRFRLRYSPSGSSPVVSADLSTLPSRKRSSQRTQRWREMDSNFRFVRGPEPEHYARHASHTIGRTRADSKPW